MKVAVSAGIVLLTCAVKISPTNASPLIVIGFSAPIGNVGPEISLSSKVALTSPSILTRMNFPS